MRAVTATAARAAAREAADAKLRATEAHYRQQYKALPIPTYSWRAVGDDFVLEDYNDAAQVIAEGGVHELTGALASRHYADSPQVLLDLTRCVTEQATIRRETRYRHPGVEQERTLALTYVFIPVGTVMLQAEDVTERKYADGQSADALLQQAALVDLAPAALIRLDLERRVTYWNSGAEALYGWSADEARGCIAHDLLKTSFHGQGRIIQRAVLEEGAWEGELHHRHRNGAELIVFSRQALQRDAAGHPTAILEINTNVTERSRTAAALQESETRLRAILDHTPSVMSLKGLDGRYLSTNLAFERLLGVTADQARGRTDAELFEEPIAISLRQNDAEVVGSRLPIQFEVVHHNPGPRTSLVMKYPLLDARGQPYAVGSIATDITEWKNLQVQHEHDRLVAEQLAVVAQLAEARDVYQAAARNLTDGLMILDRDDRVTFWNHRLEELLGVPAATAVGRGLDELGAVLPSGVIEPDPARKASAEVSAGVEDLASARAAWQVDIESGLSVMVLPFPILGPDGQFLGHARLVRDVTHERAVDRLKDRFVSMVSHELRTPMNGVIGMTELLLETPLRADQREFAETILDSGRALVVIVNDILDISRLQDGEVELEETDLDVRSVVEHIVELLIGPARRKGVELVGLVDRGVPPLLRGDPGRLRQIMTNLVGNALKFTDHGEVNLRIKAVVSGDDELVLHCEVHDTGIGIEPKALEHLFEPFKQADSSVTRRYGGTGLGLAICKRLVEAMGGAIGVSSEVGLGSTFWFTVRLKKPDEVRPPVRYSVRDLGVLLIDPLPRRRAAVCEQLAAWGVRVDARDHVSFAPGESSPAFDVVFLTTGSPDEDSNEIRERLKALNDTHVPRIVWLNPRGQVSQDLASRVWATLPSPPRRSQLFDLLAEIADQKLQGVVLPPRRSAQSSGPAATASTPLPVDSPLVLVVDDVEVNRRVAERMLARLGYRSISAESGRAALDTLVHTPCAAILMDCRMPDMDGFAATAEIRRREAGARHTPIIAMTAHANSSDRVDCLDAGMDDYLSKPVEMASLRVTMARWAPASRMAVSPIVMAATAAGGVLNLKALDQIRALDEPGQPSLLADMVHTFRASLQGYFARLTEAVAAGDSEAVADTAHALKGAAATIGAERIRAMALELEVNGRQRSLTDGDGQIANLKQACEQALAALSEEVRRTSQRAQSMEEYIGGR